MSLSEESVGTIIDGVLKRIGYGEQHTPAPAVYKNTEEEER